MAHAHQNTSKGRGFATAIHMRYAMVLPAVLPVHIVSGSNEQGRSEVWRREVPARVAGPDHWLANAPWPTDTPCLADAPWPTGTPWLADAPYLQPSRGGKADIDVQRLDQAAISCFRSLTMSGTASV